MYYLRTMPIHPSIFHVSNIVYILKPVFVVVANRRKMPQLPGNLLTTLADRNADQLDNDVDSVLTLRRERHCGAL